MTELSYKIFLDRYAQKSVDKSNIKNNEAGTIVVAITDDSDPKYPQKNVCELIDIVDDKYLVKDIFSEDTYILSLDKLTEPTELYPTTVWERIAYAMFKYENSLCEGFMEDPQDYYDLLADWKFVPAGRILASLGSDYQDSLTPFNCFVVEPPRDSRSGAINTLQTMTELMSRGGGVGINLSSLRPRHAIVRGVNGTSSGAVSWGGGYSYYTGLVEQGGSRRGALLLGLGVWHPDVIEFISSKKEAGKIENANISVFITDDFMDAVKQDTMWDLKFPDTSHKAYDTEWDGNISKWESKGFPVVVYKTMPARELWDMIIQSAWESAEPGIVWLDRCNKLSNTYYYEDIVCTNPCLTGDTLILTDNGLRRMKELYDTQEEFKVAVDSRLGNMKVTPASKVFKTGTKQVYKLITNEGYTLRLTNDHKVLTTTGWKQAKDLHPKDKILVGNNEIFNESNSLDYNIALCLGWLIGDGYIVADRKTACLGFYGNKKMISHYFKTACDAISLIVNDNYSNNIRSVNEGNVEILSSRTLYSLISKYGITNTADKKQIPDFIFKSGADAKIGFIKALFSADGHVESGKGSRHAVALTANDYKLLQDIQIILNSLGIYSTIYTNRTKDEMKLMPDGHGGHKEYHCKACHDLRVTGKDLFKFCELIGFLQDDKNDKLKAIVGSYLRGPYKKSNSATFKELIPDGVEDVYDIQVPGVNAFIANGLVVHNCGEIPLPANGVCNLGHINLAKVKLDEDQLWGIDWNDLRTTVRMGVRFLDNIIDLAYYFYEENEKVQKRSRRIGLGTMGLAELMIKLKIRYGSQTSLDFIDDLFGFIMDEAYISSAKLAHEKEPFPKFDQVSFLNSQFVDWISPEAKSVILKYGIRNATLLTQAPTGTVGTMVGTSTGIEPFYQWKYLRKCRLGDDIQYVGIAKEYMDSHPDEKELPDYFVNALGLTPEQHVKVMAKIQRYVDSSISKTVNCPAEWTPEQVGELYMMAYDLGCKGITVYRDGSRDSQVLNTIDDSSGSADTSDEVVDPLQADLVQGLKWGERTEVPADTVYSKVKFKTGCGKIILMIGYSHTLKRVIDVYTIINSAGGCQLNIQGLAITISQYLRQGGDIATLYRHAQQAGNCSSYTLQYGRGQKDLYGKSCFSGIVKAIEDFQHDSFPSYVEVTGGISESYKIGSEGADPTQQKIDPCNLMCSSCNNASVCSESHSLQKLVCPSCKEVTLVRESGCVNCYNCGYTKCN